MEMVKINNDNNINNDILTTNNISKRSIIDASFGQVTSVSQYMIYHIVGRLILLLIRRAVMLLL